MFHFYYFVVLALGDPLIKGLTEVANKRPEDPIAYLATYLYNFASSNKTKESRGKTQVGILAEIIKKTKTRRCKYYRTLTIKCDIFSCNYLIKPNMLCRMIPSLSE